jgi:hypothetical protein
MPKRAYTALRNSLLQDYRLSLGAHGLLVYLLSLRDHTPVDIKILAADFPDSQAKIAGYLHELVCWGYLIRRRVRDPETREIRTVVSVYDIPQTEDGAEDMAVVAGESSQVGPALDLPSPEKPRPYPSGKTGDKEPPQPTLPFEEPGGREDPSPTTLSQEDSAHCVAILAKIGRQEPRLSIGVLEMRPLLPLLAEWRARGASDFVVCQVLTEGLPARIHSPAALISDRLKRKMPPEPIVPVIPVRAVCPDCHRPVAGDCRHCAGQGRVQPDAYVVSTLKGVAKARALLKTGRTA